MQNKLLIIILLLPAIALSHSHYDYIETDADEKLFFEVIKREEYVAKLEKTLKDLTQSHVSISLYGEELEHLLILSPSCIKIKDYQLNNALSIGINSATCKWYSRRRFILKIN